MNEFTIAGYDFQSSKLPIMQQAYLAKRLLPLVASLDDLKMGVGVIDTLFTVSRIPDEDLSYILNVCLSVVKIKQNETYQKLWVNSSCMFDFVQLPVLFQAVINVIKDHFTGFLTALPQTPQ